ncbi:GNAT family N-acetyltransferase [Clostridium swellfunianum]|uniref:GNAT family N-acetyltransferase n=1 Tax=Clostridium swellfunianum TaxID=1367462 RepID=UPI002030C034|nr:GNAT family protein [Clostridium swellfunianum]MCM0650240.1 GNAT family N-acetyltransferase [Clostridium swellfunianum]
MNTKATCPNLETPRLLLRKLSLEDADDLFVVFSDEETTNHVPREKHEDKMVTSNHLENLIKRMDEGISFVWSVVDKTDNKVIGTVNLYFKEDRAASIGAVINSECWGKGIATEALKEIVSFGFDNMKLIRIEGKCESNNAASEKMLKKLGMSYEGTLRKEVIIRGIPRDAKVYSILNEEYNALGTN